MLTSASSIDQSAVVSGFVAINFIRVTDAYRERFEELFGSRAHAIDAMPGFRDMQVLKPTGGDEYLVLSRWDSEEAFKAWTGSEAFLAGHRRAFADMADAKARGEAPPMHSDFRTYAVLCD